ncbi:ABC transporter permease subunit [Halobacillus sp. A5]|uniref:ABC transporter permease subunit n=1 Tax=Halobacillus sp. A5 TaxID=2880263 RepID=UPI0020A65B68|nr:ABC transporter permease subunit [Halobacillus sp. A5]MCP3027528.1 ABC transporter permease [Halobacillus sp. A5]
MKVYKFLLYYILGLCGIVLISAAPALFSEGAYFSVGSYIEEAGGLISTLTTPSDWVYVHNETPQPLFEFLWEPYSYSMTIFIGAMTGAAVMAFVLAMGTFFLPGVLRGIVSRLLNLLESVPDLLLAFCIQLFIVWFYKQSDLLLMDFIAVGGERIYLLPMLTLAVLPMITLYKVVLVQLNEEMTKSYVDMARSKGMWRLFILNVHVLRNIVKSIFYHSKIVLWGALSSLLMIEYIFNINGVTNALLNGYSPMVTVMILFMLFTPFYVFYQGTELFIFKETKVAEETNIKMNSFIGSRSFTIKHGWLRRVLGEAEAHFKNVKFLIGFFILFTVTAVSIIYTVTTDPLVEQYFQIYDEDGVLESAAPHSPEFVFLGTDELGFSIFDQLMTGAKYTVLFAVAIALLRVLLGFVLAVPYAFFFPPKLQRFLDKTIDSMHFLPMTIIAYLLLYPVLWMPEGGFATTETERIVYQGFILTLLAVPLLMSLFGNEMKLIMKEEFVLSTKVLGGSSIHLLWRHLMPHLSARTGIIFGQQFIQTLLIFIHLGVFDLYFGGTKVTYDPMTNDPPMSTTYEWSGMIGASKDALMTGRWWYIMPALIGFMVLILAMQLMIQGMKDVQQRRVGVPIEYNTWLTRWKRRREAQSQHERRNPEEKQFTFLKKVN